MNHLHYAYYYVYDYDMYTDGLIQAHIISPTWSYQVSLYSLLQVIGKKHLHFIVFLSKFESLHIQMWRILVEKEWLNLESRTHQGYVS